MYLLQRFHSISYSQRRHLQVEHMDPEKPVKEEEVQEKKYICQGAGIKLFKQLCQVVANTKEKNGPRPLTKMKAIRGALLLGFHQEDAAVRNNCTLRAQLLSEKEMERGEEREGEREETLTHTHTRAAYIREYSV